MPVSEPMVPTWFGRSGNQRWVAGLVLGIVLLCIYYPVFSHRYLYHDDWIHFSSRGTSCSASPMYGWSRVTGRLIGQFILCGLFDVFETTDHAWVARAIVVGAIVAFALLQCVYFEALGLSWMAALLLSLGTSILPGMLVFAYWITAGSIVFAYIASVIAALLTHAALRLKNGSAGMIALLAGACGLQVIALLIYQTAAMYFWTLTAVMLATHLQRGLRAARRPLAIYVFTGAAPIAGYFIWFKYIAGLVPALKAQEPRRGTMFADVANGVKWFINAALPRGASLWFMETARAFGVVVLSFALVLLVVLSARLFLGAWRRGDRTEGILCAAYPLAFVVFGALAYLPMLVTTFRVEVFRSLVPLSALIFLTGAIHLGIVLHAERWAPVIRGGLGAGSMLVLSFLAMNSLASKLVVPAAAEYAYVRNSLQDAMRNGAAVGNVHAVVPRRTRKFTTDEMDNLSAWFPSNTEPMIQIIGREVGLDVGSVTSSLPDGSVDGALVLDFSRLSKAGLWKSLSGTALQDFEPVLLWMYSRYDLVAFRSLVYGVPKSLGWVNWDAGLTATLPGVVTGATIDDVLRQLQSEIVVDPQPRLLRSYQGYNLVSYRGRIYALPQSLGPVNDWESGMVGKLPGVLVGATVEEVIAHLPK